VPFLGRDESELVNELQAGSETAFDWLVTHYHGPVYTMILSMLGDTFGRLPMERRKFSQSVSRNQMFSPGQFAEDLVVSHRHREA